MAAPPQRSAAALIASACGAVVALSVTLIVPAGAAAPELTAATTLDAVDTPIGAVPFAAAPTRPDEPSPTGVAPTSDAATTTATTAATTTATTTTPPPSPTSSPTPTTRPTSTTTPAPTTTSDADVPADGPAAEVLALTNVERRAAGCRNLRADRRLAQAAQGHAEDMAEQDYFSHDSLDGRDFADRIRAAGHPSPGAENIAVGQTSAEEVVAGWMASPGHRRNILDCSLVTLGVGYTPDGHYWVQNFGR